MISTLERLGVRMLSWVAPQVTASAGPCSCTDGHTWCCDQCSGGGINGGNTCRSDCSGTYGCKISCSFTWSCL
jgi:hypothetical protein